MFLGRLFGEMTLISMIKAEKPLPRNMGSLPELIVTEQGNELEHLIKQWITSTEEYAHLDDEQESVHSFLAG